MHYQQQLHHLRIQLLGISRLSQRALDYSVKGYELGCPNFCKEVSSAEHALDEHHNGIRDLCRRLIIVRGISPSDLRFVLAALRIDSGFHASYCAAKQVACETALLLKSGHVVTNAALIRLGNLANCLMRLCVVALFQQETVHAETVLHSHEEWRRCEHAFEEMHRAHPRVGTQTICERVIVRSLGIAARQAHEIADATLFWLQGRDRVPTSETHMRKALGLIFASPRAACDDAATT